MDYQHAAGWTHTIFDLIIYIYARYLFCFVNYFLIFVFVIITIIFDFHILFIYDKILFLSLFLSF